MRLTRQFWVVLHRWAGLTMALFLAVAGFTGIFLAWNDELDGLTAPGMHYAAPPHPGARMMGPLEIRRQVLARYPAGRIGFIELQQEAGKAFKVHVEWPGVKNPPAWDDLFIDPYTGEELGRREWGNIGQGLKNLMPFVYLLHYQLALGPYAQFAFGIAAVIWTIDCFVGFYLTLPVRSKRVAGRAAKAPSWWSRWRPSWAVRWGASAYKLNFDLHRAGGLWIWPLLLVFAWSSVSLTLPQVYSPVMSLFGAKDTFAYYTESLLPKPRENPRMAFDAALPRGEALAAEQAAKAGLVLRSGGGRYLWHVPAIGAYVYGFTSSADVSVSGSGTAVAFDSDTGALKAFIAPSGRNGANTFTTWIKALHMADVFGLWWKIAVSLIGGLVTMLSVTGVVIWMKKRSGRVGRKLRKTALN